MANEHGGDGPLTSQQSNHSKACYGCARVLPLSEFYTHPKMADGRLGLCKECHKDRVKKNREKKLDYYLEYDRRREFRPDRVEARALYRKTEEYRKSQAACGPKWDANNKEKKRAHVKVRRAILGGLLAVAPCESCGTSERVQAHHDDYSKPLDVRWLCTVCHGAHHRRFDPETGKKVKASTARGGAVSAAGLVSAATSRGSRSMTEESQNRTAANYVMATAGPAELAMLKAHALNTLSVSTGNVESCDKLLLLQEIERLHKLVIHYADMAGIPEAEARERCQI